ncbi:MAG: (2Fe-2S)-binding protein [Deltaproteobacteria bacterium]|nr:(2Fe-2S)-binding protein [Deltaproteobacteria bacterium]
MKQRVTTPPLRIDTDQKRSFSFDGKPMIGYGGDTVATALVGCGVKILSRSFKYHRPRGLFSLDGESANSLMQIDKMPNVRGEIEALKDGIQVRSQNVVGSLNFDLMATTEKVSRFLQPGFYYKIFHKPYKLWPFFQNRIRKAAGLGVMDPGWQPGKYDNVFLHADVCVVGGGLSGMTAALTAADQGLNVILLEARPWLGGRQDWRIEPNRTGEPAFKAIRALAKKVQSHGKIDTYIRAPLNGLYHDNLITAFQRGTETDNYSERYLEIRAKQLVVATGVIERPLVFENNERPGVMTSDCAMRLLMHYGIKPGDRVVFSTGHDRAVETAKALTQYGITIAAFADSRDSLGADLIEQIRQMKIPLLQGWVAREALGKKRLKGVVLSAVNQTCIKRISCDALVASAGTHPAMGPLLLTREKTVYDQNEGVFKLARLPAAIQTAGSAAGIVGEAALAASGKLAGLRAAADCQMSVQDEIAQTETDLASLNLARNDTRLVRSDTSGKKSFVCFDEDVTVDNIHHSVSEGFDTIELCKRYATIGMGPSQSGIPGVNFPLVLAQCLNLPPGDIPPTVVRPPLYPALLATYVGKDYTVEKRTPLHDDQQQVGAHYIWMGKWKRASQFADVANIASETRAVHQRAGIMDVSTLGKFRIYGPDALKALQYLYVSDMSVVTENRLTYVAMCNHDGNLIDDGVVTRMGENDYYITTSSGRADETIAWFRYWTRDKSWDYNIVNLTDCLGALCIAGPQSRQILEKILSDDISNEALAYMGFKQTVIQEKIPARLLRLGFLGEFGYEIHAPASYLPSIWYLLMKAGKPFGIEPFGTETQNVLRLEKGHVIIGLDSEIRTTLCDVGLGFLWSRKKKDADAIGIPALRHTENQKARMKLVGLEIEDPSDVPPDFSLIVDNGIKGHITCVRHSEVLGKTIGMALVNNALATVGTRVEIYSGTNRPRSKAVIVKKPFYDPKGLRLRV